MVATLRDRGNCLVTAISVFSPYLFVAAVGKNVHIYRPRVDGPIRSLYGASEGDGLVQLALSSDGAYVYVGTSEGVGVHETHTGHRVGQLAGRLRGLAVSGDRLATVAFDKKVRIFS